MTNRSDKFKGTLYADGEILYAADLNDTNSGIIDMTGVGIAQNAYQTLQANNVFENKDFLFVDEFTDSTGTNNTVTGGTAFYDALLDAYVMNALGDGTNDTTNTGLTKTGTNTGTLKMGIKITVDESLTIKTVTKHADCNATTCYITDSTGAIYSTATFSSNVATFTGLMLKTGNDYYILVDKTGDVFTHVYYDFSSYPVDGTYINITAGNNSGTPVGDQSTKMYNITQIVSQTATYENSTVIIAPGKTLLGTEESICVYADKTTPTGSAILVDDTDGTTTLSNKNVNEVIGLTGFSSGTLGLTFKLNGTTTVTPLLKGYGAFIK